MPTESVSSETSQLEAREVSRRLWLRQLMGPSAARDEVDLLARRMEEFSLRKGAYLYRLGGAADHIYFVLSGWIKQGEAGATEFREGSVLGVLDALQERPHRADALAMTESRVLQLSVDDWLDFVEDNFDLLREMMFERGSQLPLSAGARGDVNAGLVFAGVDQLSGESTARGGTFVTGLLAFHSCALLRKASIQAVAQLVRGAEVVVLDQEPRELGTYGRGLWVVSHGQVTVEARRGEEQLLQRVGPGGLLGTLAFLGTPPETFLVHAEGQAYLHFVDEEVYFDVMEDHFDLARSSMAYVASLSEELNLSASPPKG